MLKGEGQREWKVVVCVCVVDFWGVGVVREGGCQGLIL